METRTYSARCWEAIRSALEGSKDSDLLVADLQAAIEEAPGWSDKLAIELDDREVEQVDTVIERESINVEA